MPYEPSHVPDLTETLPAALSLSDTAASAYPADAGWDVTIGKLGFRLRATQQAPYRRETDQVSKQQVDTSDEAGEQSLSTWWMRSQASWHMGSGTTWYEPGADKDTQHRFATSHGIDPWTLGEIRLLRRCDAVGEGSGSPVYLSTMRLGLTDAYVAVTGDKVTWCPNGAAEQVFTMTSASGQQPTTNGSSAWIGNAGGVARFNALSLALTQPLTATATCRAWWVKSRLIVAVGAALYEVPPTVTGEIATVGSTLYTHPDSSWKWTDVDEAGEAIIAAGYADSESAIYRFSIENDTEGQPQLSGASQVARMPPGEQIHAMRIYLGAYVVLGTSSGARIGIVSAAGEVQYGPLTVTTSYPVVNMTFRDRFAYVVATGCQPDDSSGAARIDLSAPIGDSGRYAWAWDASTGFGGTASSICFVGSQDRLVLAAGGQRYVQSATQYVSEGVLETGRVRYRTVEQKAFRLARLICTLNDGQVRLTAVAPDDTEHRVYTYAAQSATSADVGISIPGRTINQYLAFRMALTPSSGGTASPIVSGFSVKAVPAASRMRLVQFPVSLYDFEVGKSGQRIGVEGGALKRLLALEAMEDAAYPVTVRHLSAGDAFVGLIESTAFSSSAPPDHNQSGFGGTALITIRKL